MASKVRVRGTAKHVSFLYISRFEKSMKIKTLFKHFVLYLKIRKEKQLLQSVTKKFLHKKIQFFTKCDKKLLQSMSVITKCDKVYYKKRQVLQSVTSITNCDTFIK